VNCKGVGFGWGTLSQVQLRKQLRFEGLLQSRVTVAQRNWDEGGF
jgi:hypothetical protein